MPFPTRPPSAGVRPGLGFQYPNLPARAAPAQRAASPPLCRAPPSNAKRAAAPPPPDGQGGAANRLSAAHGEEGPLVPYDVTVLPPPVVHLGRFLLPSKVDSGHLLRLGDGDGAQSYVVRGVRFRYALQGGRWRMTGKSVEVKTVARRVLEAHLEGVLGKS